MKNILEKTFHLRENNTTIKTELVAGFITFLTMSYILIVNPNILSQTGMDKEALFTTTALVTIFTTLLMGLYAKLPIAQAPGMGLNNFFAFSVVLTMGYTWQFALSAVFISGVFFLLLTIFNIRELIVKSIPKVLKDAIPVGIGLFITLVGLKQSGIIVSNPSTLVSLGDFSQHGVWITFVGLIVTAVLLARNTNGAILIGIIISTIFAFCLGDISFSGNSIISMPPSIEPIFGKAFSLFATDEGWKQILSIDMLVVVFTFLFVNIFDTIGTLIGVISKTNIADSQGNFPQMKKALLTDAIGTTAGSILGTSSVTSYVESASGVAAGGRTGLTAVSVALMFAIAMFFSPLFLLIPTAATSSALIIVGLFMIYSVSKIDFSDVTNGLPAFLTIIFMPFAYSIAEGIVFGILSFVFLKLFTGKNKEITPTIIVLSIFFILKIVLGVIYNE